MDVNGRTKLGTISRSGEHEGQGGKYEGHEVASEFFVTSCSTFVPFVFALSGYPVPQQPSF